MLRDSNLALYFDDHVIDVSAWLLKARIFSSGPSSFLHGRPVKRSAYSRMLLGLVVTPEAVDLELQVTDGSCYVRVDEVEVGES